MPFNKRFNLNQSLHVIGAFIIVESFFMLFSALVSFIYGEDDLYAILESAGITALVGLLVRVMTRSKSTQIHIREGYFITASVWIVFSFFGALPFLISGSIPTLTDAYFETVSGFTTTGASILNNIEDFSHGLLFWRSLIQWLGGMGIMVLTLAILPSLGSSLRLFASEVPGPTVDRLQPRIRESAKQRNVYGCFILVSR